MPRGNRALQQHASQLLSNCCACASTWTSFRHVLHPLAKYYHCCLQDPLFGGQGSTENVRHGSFSNPTGPPPPYESVMTDAASHSLPAGSMGHAGAAGTMHTVPGVGAPPSTGAQVAASNGSAGLHATDAAGGPVSHFEIAVADPVKQGEGVSAFVSYKVGAFALVPCHLLNHEGYPHQWPCTLRCTCNSVTGISSCRCMHCSRRHYQHQQPNKNPLVLVQCADNSTATRPADRGC